MTSRKDLILYTMRIHRIAPHPGRCRGCDWEGFYHQTHQAEMIDEALDDFVLCHNECHGSHYHHAEDQE